MKQQKISREALVERMIGEFRKAMPNCKIKEKGFGVEINLDNGISMVADFHNLYEEINSSNGDMEASIKNRIEVFKQNASRMGSMSKDPKVTKKLLRENSVYLAKDKNFVKQAESNAPNKQMVISKPLATDILKCAAIDYERYQMFLTSEMVKKFDLEEVHQLVQDATDRKKLNIEEIDNEIERLDKHPVKILVARQEQTQVSSLACSPKQMLKYTGGKRHLAVLPFRDFMVISEIKEFANKKEQAAFELKLFMELWNVAKGMTTDKIRPYPISDKPFLINEKGEAETYKNDIVKDGTMMAVQVDKETGKKSVAGMINMG